METPETGVTDPNDPDVRRLIAGELHDPFRVLGPRTFGVGKLLICVHKPDAYRVRLATDSSEFRRIGATDLFEWSGAASDIAMPARVITTYADGTEVEEWDIYAFPPQLPDHELSRFAAGDHCSAHALLGAHMHSSLQIAGVRFAVWAPNAARVSVVGYFNNWDGRCHPMRVRGDSGVWELFVPDVDIGSVYKYEIFGQPHRSLRLKADPYARAAELRPGTASLVTGPSRHRWQDQDWIERRQSRDWLRAPMSLYEVHLGSWKRHPGGGALTYRELARELIPYVRDHGFTHIELMPITEYPYDESWGYQPTGYFAPTRRYGEPDDLRFFIDQCHQHDIGVVLDWVPGHFPKDAHGLAEFDGTALYEYADRRKGEHPDWGTLVFNYERHEVRSFLFSSALYWLEEFHFDGLRVDAVASMLYLDYSRSPGQWAPNVHGGNENLEAISFLRRLNELTHARVPGSITVAEESTAWPGVSRPGWAGGLGFSMKWNLGWMHDTLSYMAMDPVHRRHQHSLINFAAHYAFSENFILPLSHDEVVHEKRSLLGRMPGDTWQRFANLRLLYALQWLFPGKKLLFMGAELAQAGEWDAAGELPWHVLQESGHAGIWRLIRDLNGLYCDNGALHRRDFEPSGFQWLQCNDHEHSVLAWLRTDGQNEYIVVLNFTPVVRNAYPVGLPHRGIYIECLNSDSRHYGGSDLGNPLPVRSSEHGRDGFSHSIELSLPPLGAIVLRRESEPQPA